MNYRATACCRVHLQSCWWCSNHSLTFWFLSTSFRQSLCDQMTGHLQAWIFLTFTIFLFWDIIYHATLLHFFYQDFFLATLHCLSFGEMLLLALAWPISMTYLFSPFWDLCLCIFKTWHVRNFLGDHYALQLVPEFEQRVYASWTFRGALILMF